jgi:hypothetical protein
MKRHISEGVYRAIPSLILVWAIPAIFTLLLLPHLFFFVGAGVSRVAWPWQIDYAEGVNLDAAWLLSQGYNIYYHNGPDSFISAPYPPFLFILTVPFQWLFGPSFTAGRAIALISTIIVAALIAYIVWKLTSIGRRICPQQGKTTKVSFLSSFVFRTLGFPSSVFAGALWLSLSPVIVWSAFFRQDIPSMCLDLAGLVVMLRARSARRLGAALVAILLFTLAFYTKQSALAGAAATCTWLVVRDWRFGLRFTASLGASILLPFLTANLLLQGALWEHLVGYHSLPFSEKRFMSSVNPLLREYWPTLLIAFLTLAVLVAYALPRRNTSALRQVRRWWHSPLALIALYTLFGWASTVITIGYEGAIFNHLLDGLLPTCILVGLAAYYPANWLARHLQNPQYRLVGLGLTGLLSVAFVVQLTLFNPPQTWLSPGWPSDQRNGELQGISQVISQTPGDMFSEDSYLLLANGKLPIYEDASTFVPLANLHKWDDSAFNKSLRDRRFSLIILYQGGGRWTQEGLRAFTDSYEMKFRGSVEVYEPKLFPDSAQYSLLCNLTHEGDTVTLSGYSLPPGVADTGVFPDTTLRVQLLWRTQKPLKANYATYVHLLTDKGDFVAGQDNQDTGATKPTETWSPGQIISDTASLPLHQIGEGSYRLVAGMYRLDKGSLGNFTPACEQGEVYHDAISLGWVNIKGPPPTLHQDSAPTP